MILTVNGGWAGCEEKKVFYHMLYKVPSGKFENMPGNSQGKKFSQCVGTLYNNIGPKWHLFYMGDSLI